MKNKKINKIGGEFELIKRLTKDIDQTNPICPIGDDAAVLPYTKEKYLLITTDMLLEGDHFNLSWFSGEQIGKKCMEANVSDIAAMGGIPTHAFVSIALPHNTELEFIEKLYLGMKEVCKKYDFIIAGGDTTKGEIIVINITLLGEVEKENLTLRSSAKLGDLIYVSGNLGGSAAALELLMNGISGNFSPHLEPKSRLFLSRKIAKIVNAMIDVSDGLASEVRHICGESNKGAIVYKERIPLSTGTRKAAKKLKKDPFWFALSGGEDFELIFTLPKRHKEFVESLGCIFLGEVKEKEFGVKLSVNGELEELKGGFNHFAYP